MRISPEQLGPNSRCRERLAMGLKSYNESEPLFNFTVAGHPPGRRSLPNEAGPGLSHSARPHGEQSPRRKARSGHRWGLAGPKRKAVPGEVAEQPQLLQVSGFIVSESGS